MGRTALPTIHLHFSCEEEGGSGGGRDDDDEGDTTDQ